MTSIVYPDDTPYRLTFFLALEEWVACNMPAGEYIFKWNVKPTVIIGHNQDITTEVNLEYCHKHHIDVVRRRSGGGCVYADRDNIMTSYITSDTNVAQVFARYTSMMARQLSKLGFDAEPSGRNDITIGERKISGNAFYLLSDRSIVHGTMLYDTNLQHMLNAITPSKAKLESHKVKSVASRIVTAKDLSPDMTFDFFNSRLLEGLVSDSYVLSDDDLKAVSVIEERYNSPRWINEGKND